MPATEYRSTPRDDPKKLLFIKAMVGWLRWQLAGDQSHSAKRYEPSSAPTTATTNS